MTTVEWVTINGVAWCYRPGTIDLSVIDHVFTQNGYHMPEHMHGWFVVDVGAHIGSASILAARRGASVLAYEPCQENYDLLVTNVVENKVMVYTEPWGVGPQGPHRLYLDHENTGQNTIYSDLNGVNPDDYEWIACRSLNTILSERHCDLLKLDCEGCEESVLQEIIEGLWRQVDRIAVEMHFLERAQNQLDELSLFYSVTALGSDEYLLERAG